MIKFSLLGETILEWNDKDIEHYHARRMAMDSMLCRFKVYAILVSVLWSMAMLCMAFFVPRMPLSEQGIWQRRGLSLGRFLSIFILGFRVLSSFSFRCSWYLVATVSCCGRSLLVHSSGVTFCVSRHLLLFVLVCCLDAFPLPHEDCTDFFCFALLCTSLMLFVG